MGGCTTSKYAVDEDKAPKKEKKPSNKNKNKKDSQAEHVDSSPAQESPVTEQQQTPNGQVTTDQATPVKSNDQDQAKIDSQAKDIEFIDKEDKNAPTSAANLSASENKDNDDTKKEVTTYQTTVVKHTQKEGDELLQHLKEEAFRSLQNLLKQDTTKQTTRSTTASTANSEPQTSTDSSQDDIVEQIKIQVVNSIGKSKQETIHLIIDNGIDLIKQNKVKNMNELQASLEKILPDTESDKNSELIKKVINGTTGFLTAKGTEAGALLSNILANAGNGLTGVMNETEKTTVKVTRTVTEQIMSGGQLKEVTRVITSTEPAPPCAQNIQDVLRNLQNGLSVDGTPFTTTTTTLISEPTINVTTGSPSKVVTSGNSTTLSSTLVNESHETLEQKEESLTETKVINEDSITKSQAEHVVTTAVNAAVERVIDESQSQQSVTSKLTNGTKEVITNGNHVESSVKQTESHTEHFHEENIKVEEESSIKCSTTKIILNGSSKDEELKLNSFDLDQVQSQFYKHGKEAAEEVVQQLHESTFNESHQSQQSSSTNATSTTTTTTLVTE